MLDRPTRKSPGAARMARLRHRARLRLKVFHIELSEYDVVSALLDRKLLSDEEALDDGRVTEALAGVRTSRGNQPCEKALLPGVTSSRA